MGVRWGQKVGWEAKAGEWSTGEVGPGGVVQDVPAMCCPTQAQQGHTGVSAVIERGAELRSPLWEVTIRGHAEAAQGRCGSRVLPKAV